jgi:hypothetical protein
VWGRKVKLSDLKYVQRRGVPRKSTYRRIPLRNRKEGYLEFVISKIHQAF